ncbi:MAG: hypothetical protein IPM29_12920 [Planctomycetes bacterium]|nr:hypothetical protein [Planctomycetota bacterium]
MLRTLAAVSALAALSAAQSPTPARPSPEQALREKLASPFLRHADWTTDYDDALAAAAREDRLIFAYFTTAYH